MSTPQGPGPHPPQGNPADQPAEQPAWGQQPPGGWGQPAQDGNYDYDPDATRAVNPQGWGQQQPPPAQGGWGGPEQQQPPYGGQQGAQPQYGGQQPPYGGQQYGQQPPPGQWGGQPQQGGPQQGGPQQGWPPPQAQPGQQGWQPGPEQGWQGQQPQQQWGGQPQGAPQQQWGGAPAAAPAAARGGRSKLPLILGAVVVLIIAAVAVLGFVTPGFFVSKVFDTAAVQNGVTKVLNDSYAVKATGVTCDKDVKVVKGATFSCKATVDGAQVTVPIRITGDDGAYEVGRPA
ncbi:DUF4333 domain-containing protein [Pseudonocardia sp. GCM10023141]|uniref:DUF4333 domain-containing protein n=1 Tax=Pseudonocardia sp. GCM10023141 TaxID=3252653 RepID=UPI003621D925